MRHLHPQAWQVRCARERVPLKLTIVFCLLKSAQRRALEHARLTELQEAWERRDFATAWKLTRILTIRPKIDSNDFGFFGIT